MSILKASLLLDEEVIRERYGAELVVSVRVEEPLRDVHGVVDGVVQDRTAELVRE